ncbi:MAG: hypothetical protein LBL46_01975 [Rickettsiales bacterium]|jgi:hypothetical protein|nr:hypothetical protein [Rickettsiales bacterium]
MRRGFISLLLAGAVAFVLAPQGARAAVVANNGAGQRPLGADFRGRARAAAPAAAPVVTATTTTTTIAGAVVVQDVRGDFMVGYDALKNSLKNAREVCAVSSGAADGAIGELGALLGGGIAQIAGGAVGAAAGGFNIALTSKTIDDEAALPGLEAAVATAQKELDELLALENELKSNAAQRLETAKNQCRSQQ